MQHAIVLHNIARACTHGLAIKVAAPSTLYDLKGLLKTAVRDNNPVIFFEDKLSFSLKGPVPEEEYTIPFGVADIKREGTHISLVTFRSQAVPFLLNLNDIKLVTAEILTKLHYRAGAYLYRDGTWLELPNQRNPEYRQASA